MQRTATVNRWLRQALLAALLGTVGATHVAAQFRDVTPGRNDSTSSSESTSTEDEIAQPVDPESFAVDNTASEEDAPIPEPIPQDEIPEADEDAADQPEATHDTHQEIVTDDVELIELIDDTTIRPLKFRGVTVGETSRDELLELWGEPFKSASKSENPVIKYHVDPFRQVDVMLSDDTVQSILIHLEDALEPTHCASELRMTKIEPVPIPDQHGRLLGMVYPERGVMLGFDPRYPENLIAKVQLEPINPEPFLLRAEYDYRQNFTANLADIDQALEMDPEFARAHWVKARLLAKVGRTHDAQTAAGKSVQYHPDSARFRLTKAQIIAASGDYDVSLREAKLTLDQDELHPVTQAAGELLVGNIYAWQAPGRFKEAMQHHLAAIELAAQLVNDPRFEVRRLAKEILVDCHLAVARNISLGEYDRQDVVVPKWLARAAALVEEYVQRDEGDPALRLKLYRQMLATAADLRSDGDPATLIRKLREAGRKQIALVEDEYNQSRIEWLLGTGLAEAVRLQRLRGDQADAMHLADDALVLLQQSAKRRQSTPEQRHLVGRLYFHVGSLHAVHRKDHDEAISWYRKAEPLLNDEVPPSTLADAGTHGEMFVSMGVSYWQSGQRMTAITLTEQGTDILQRAVVDGNLDPTVLSVPYGNLATMHQKTGNKKDAEAFAELASSIQIEAEETTRR